MNRKTALENLIQFKLPIEQAISDLAQFEWDSEIELVSLEAAQIHHALQLFTQGTISSFEVEAWANAIECREDIKIEPLLVNEALHELANPQLTQQLSVERASFWLSQPLLANPSFKRDWLKPAPYFKR
ncbi:hypothetical protein [Methylophilus sp. UBA6697]|jgi:hypothetical protein|uniref:hypothetical protein n=1 Tax=Methylophilus sp. UBA6697 TaxID=1946902 RepID=UPI000ECF9831|nr:hypothetical protein [Methylophilus sp. UBA6697]HCU84759.1 hypothetical protein [Methylophilus sp.]